MTTQAPIRFTEEVVAALDAVVAWGRFANWSEARRAGLERVLSEARGRELEAAYRRGYGEAPQEEWAGEIGLAGLAVRGGRAT